jgi:hypothetical protein
MGDRYKQICVVFYIHEPSFYEYFHVLTLSHANHSSGALNYQVHRWCNEISCQNAFHLGKVNTSYIYRNNRKQWCGVVYDLNPTFFEFVDDFLHYVIHLSKRFLCGGGWTWRLVVILFFPHCKNHHLMS